MCLHALAVVSVVDAKAWCFRMHCMGPRLERLAVRRPGLEPSALGEELVVRCAPISSSSASCSGGPMVAGNKATYRDMLGGESLVISETLRPEFEDHARSPAVP